MRVRQCWRGVAWEDGAEVVRVGLMRVSAGSFGGRCRLVAEAQARSFGAMGGRGARGRPAENEGIGGISGGCSGGGEGIRRAWYAGYRG